MELKDHQLEAIENLGSGKILYGGVGSGKTAAVLGYYVAHEEYRDIYVITTAKKRDSLEWEGEAAKFGIGTVEGATLYGKLTVDSWNNIGKYVEVEDAFFVFDEQRVVGHGAWVRAFLKIAKKNRWVLLSATPGDVWLDYAPVFIANGYYKNITDFKREHVLYEPFLKFPVIRAYLNEGKLEMLRNDVLVEMPYYGDSKRIYNWWPVMYDIEAFRRIYKDRWNIYEDRPIKDAAELFRVMRRLVNSDPSRLREIQQLLRLHPRLIVFYNFDYELEILRTLEDRTTVCEWNGHKKHHLHEFQDFDTWVYLVQYQAGAEGWNCTSTDAMALYSLNYSYRLFVQAPGRIDRMDTLFPVLYYYIFVSNSFPDRAIKAALKNKRDFNERRALKEAERYEEAEDAFVETCEILDNKV